MLSLGTSLLHLQKVINRILILYDARKYILIIGTIFVSRILQWREFTRWGLRQGVWWRKSPSGVQGQRPGRRVWGTSSPEA